MVRGAGAGRVAIIYGQVRRYKENGGAKEEKKKGRGKVESIDRKSWRRTVSVTRVTIILRGITPADYITGANVSETTG